MQMVYLFTCGQAYMVKEAKKHGINETFFKLFHIIGIGAAIINSILTSKNTIWESVMYACVIVIFSAHIFVVKKIIQRAKNGRKSQTSH